ncbi:Plasmid segregation centromere-binding protein ParG [Gammaproteobacteria bacterium]
MPITIPRKKPSAEDFISNAPDAQVKTQKKRKGNAKIRIHLTIPEGLLEDLDDMATDLDVSRTSAINNAIYKEIRAWFALKRKQMD